MVYYRKFWMEEIFRLLFITMEKGKERNSPYLIFHQAANRKPISAIRFGDYKLVKDWRYNKLELFDLSRDIEEKLIYRKKCLTWLKIR